MKKPVAPPRLIKQEKSQQLKNNCSLENIIEAKHQLLSSLSEDYEGEPPTFKLSVQSGSNYYHQPPTINLVMKCEDKDPKYAEKMERYHLDYLHYRQSLENRLLETKKELEKLLQEPEVK